LTPPTKLLSRRTSMLTIGLTLTAPALVAQTVPTHGGDLSPPEAHALANSGQIILVDVRRPDEWAQTGSGEGAYRIDMRRDDFVTELLEIVGGDTSAPVAVICARGVRSNRMSRTLINAGFTNIIDVPEGMLGSRAGPGWIARDLPLNRS